MASESDQLVELKQPNIAYRRFTGRSHGWLGTIPPFAVARMNSVRASKSGIVPQAGREVSDEGLETSLARVRPAAVNTKVGFAAACPRETTMTILVTGATGKVGSHVLQHLSGQDVAVRALTRDPAKAKFPNGVVPVRGDMLDIESMRNALAEASTLFLLNAVTPQELSEALLTLNLAREGGIQRVVYLSVFRGKDFANVPHFTAKHTVEQMIEQFDIPATILRPNCFMQNDVMFKDAVMGAGIYPFPIGDKGVSMVDTRDVAEIAAKALAEREQTTEPLPLRVIDVVGPEALTGAGIAAIWSDLLGKPVRYAGDNVAPSEKQLAQHAPSWLAMDMRLMLERFQQDGMRASASDIEEMTSLLGRPPRSYADFAAETLEQWHA